MWLLNTTTLQLHEFMGEQFEIPHYAILSHTWSTEEVTFRDMRKSIENARQKTGFAKIEGCCRQALKDHLDWVWIDTCCIDKRSSAELAEAINSMFN